MSYWLARMNEWINDLCFNLSSNREIKLPFALPACQNIFAEALNVFSPCCQIWLTLIFDFEIWYRGIQIICEQFQASFWTKTRQGLNSNKVYVLCVGLTIMCSNPFGSHRCMNRRDEIWGRQVVADRMHCRRLCVSFGILRAVYCAVLYPCEKTTQTGCRKRRRIGWRKAIIGCRKTTKLSNFWCLFLVRVSSCMQSHLWFK